MALLSAAAHAAPPTLPTELGTCPPGAATVVERRGDARVVSCARGDGSFDGPMARWQGDQLVETGSYAGGLRTGTWTTWHAPDKRAHQATWVGGLQVGDWTSWDTAGQVVGKGSAIPLELAEMGLPTGEPGEDGRVPVRVDLGGAVAAPLGWGGGELLVPTARHLLSLDPVTGDVGWLAPLVAAPLPGLTGDAEVIVLADSAGGLVRIHPFAAQSHRVATGRTIEAVVHGERAFAVVIEDVGRLTSLDLDTGRVRWKSLDFYGPAQPVSDGVRLFAVRGRSLRSLDPETGDIRWTATLPHRPVSLAVAMGKVGVFDSRGVLHTFDAVDGATGWSSAVLGSRGLAGATLAADADGWRLWGRTGAWALDTSGALVSRISTEHPVDDVVVDDRLALAVGHEDGALRLWQPDLDGPAAIISLAGTAAPFVAGGRVWLPGADNWLLAVDPLHALAQQSTGLDSVSVDPAVAEGVGAALLRLEGGPGNVDPVASFFALQDVEGNVLDGLRSVAGEADDGDCHRTVLSIDLSPVDAMIRAREVTPEALATPASLELYLDALVLPTLIDQEIFKPEPAWQILGEVVREEAGWWHQWAPEVTSAWPFRRDEDLERDLSAVLSCGLDAVSYEGVLELHDGTRAWRYEGAIVLESDAGRPPWDADSCLVYAEAGGEALGWWTGPDRVGWVDLALVDDDVAALDQGLRRTLPAGGQITLMAVGEREPLVVELGPGTALGLRQVRGSLVLEADEGAWMVTGLRPDEALPPELTTAWNLQRSITWPLPSRWLPLGAWEVCAVD